MARLSELGVDFQHWCFACGQLNPGGLRLDFGLCNDNPDRATQSDPALVGRVDQSFPVAARADRAAPDAGDHRGASRTSRSRCAKASG